MDIPYIDVSGDPILLEGLLQNLVVVDEFKFVLRCKVHFRNRNCARVNRINDLAVDPSRGALLDFGELQVQQRVRPVE